METVADPRQRFLTLPRRAQVAVLATTVAVLLVVGTVVWSLVAPDDDTINAYLEKSGLAGSHELRVGIFQDQPLLSYAKPEDRDSTSLSDHSGFEIELIQDLAEYLGFTEHSVRLINTQVQNRGADLNDEIVDVVVATYSITDEREKNEVNFAGPYLTAMPEILMRADSPVKESITIQELGQLGDKLCTVGSSTSDDALRARGINEFRGVAASDDCVQGVLDKTYDAFMLDDAVLAGYVAQNQEELKLVDLVLNQSEKYGIAVANDDEYLRQVIGNFLLDSYERGENGAWRHAWNGTLGLVLRDKRQPRPEGVRVLRDHRDGIQAQLPLYQPPATAPRHGPTVQTRVAPRRRRQW
jgi:glutamate transport system substrate-binding protein